jgi:pyruvate dehydrogenase E2 component (dihydrolipoamide acetyltransferase)
MAVEIFVHKMTEHMETAKILGWLAREGDVVTAGQAILEVETDKAVVELQSPASGVIKGIRPGAEAGAEVKVGETLAFVAEAQESVPVLPALVSVSVQPPSQVPETAPGGLKATPTVRATPVARRVAKELGVDLSNVKGTGQEGRIGEEDVRAFAARGAPAATDSGMGADRLPGEWLELPLVQRITGKRMLESALTAPQFVLAVDVDASEILALKAGRSAGASADEGTGLSVTSVFVKAVALTLKAHPRLNASFVEGRVRLHTPINIGVAVGSEAGLFVPVVQAADEKPLAEIDRQIRSFQEKAQRMRFSEGDLVDGTFTITNLGMYGVDRFEAIINPPQSAILALGRIRDVPIWTSSGTPAVSPMITLSLTIDHRVLDGLHGAQFLEALKARLEWPGNVTG